MELKIVSPTAMNFNEAVGISEERAKELTKKMDDLVRSYNGLVRTCDVFNDIAHLCNNVEELVACTIIHCSWHAAHGRILCPPEKKHS